MTLHRQGFEAVVRGGEAAAATGGGGGSGGGSGGGCGRCQIGGRAKAVGGGLGGIGGGGLDRADSISRAPHGPSGRSTDRSDRWYRSDGLSGEAGLRPAKRLVMILGPNGATVAPNGSVCRHR